MFKASSTPALWDTPISLMMILSREFSKENWEDKSPK